MRLIIRLISAVFVALALVLGAVLLLPGEKIAELAAEQLEKQTGRTLSFSGPVRLSLWPTLGMKADGVTLSNADWGNNQPLLRAERLTIGLSAADLLRGDVKVTEVSAVLPHLNLQTREDGQGNWVFDEAASANAELAEPRADTAVSVESLMLTGASLRYAAHGAEPIEMKQIDLTAHWPDPQGTAQIDLTLRPEGEPVRLRGEIGTFAQFLQGAVSSVGMSVDLPGAKARFDGNVDLAGDAKGRLTVDAQAPEQAAAAIGMVLPLEDAVLFAGDVTYTSDGKLSVRDMDLTALNNQLNGALDLNVASDVPNLTLRLKGGDLLVPDLAGSDNAPSSGWSKDPIDASALSLVNGKLSLSFDSLRAGDLQLGPSALSVTIDRARAVLEMQPAQAFGGTIQGQFVANNRNGLSVGGDLSFNGIRLEQALGQTAGFDRLNGELLGELDFLGVGNSLDTIMNSLSGTGWFEVGKGFYTGFDLEALMRSGGGNGGSTVFDAMSASFALKEGVLSNSDLLASVKGAKVTGAGSVDIGAQTLDYLFKPTLSAQQGLSIPVKVTGPWSDPKIRPDLEGALKPKLDEVETQVKEQAKEKLREKLSEELNADIAPEQDLNEVLKERIEQEAKDQLLKLLGGN